MAFFVCDYRIKLKIYSLSSSQSLQSQFIGFIILILLSLLKKNLFVQKNNEIQ